MKIRCVVSCRDANGIPSFYPCTVEVTEEQYKEGDHYDEADVLATDAGYEDVGLVYDENDGPKFLFDNLFK